MYVVRLFYKEEFMSCDVVATAEGSEWFDVEEIGADKESTCWGGNFQQVIFIAEDIPRKMVKPVKISFSWNEVQQKVASCAQQVPALKVKGSVEVGGSFSWGGSDGVQSSGYVKADVQDDKGNKVEVEVEQKSDGKGNASISVSHEETDSGSSKDRK